MLASIGFGLVCASVGTLLSSLSSSFSLSNSFVTACKMLNLRSGDSLPMVNAEYSHPWGTRLLIGLPVGLSSVKVIDQHRAIAEALRVDPESLEMIYKNDGLVIDIITQPIPQLVQFDNSKCKQYAVPIGVNKRGEWRYYDFNGPYPHLLIGGISGGGKSVMLRVILTSLVTNSAVDLYLCDLKGGVELGIFRNLKCVNGFATTLTDVLSTATLIETEMIRRYEIMAENGSQSWEGDKAVFVIDELADFKVRQGDPDRNTKAAIKTKLTLLSAKGRAAGVILVLGTQRPSADVVDGLIKTNIAASICFRTRDGMQSRIILDHDRAASLPEIPGRLIFQTAHDETLQAPFLTAEQARKLIKDLPKKQKEAPRNGSNRQQVTGESFSLDGNFIEL